jgi:hypothetical protein
MELILEVKDNKAPIFLEILKEFSYVKVKKQTLEDEEDDKYCQKLYDESLDEKMTYRPITEALLDIEKIRKENGL